MNNTRMVRKRRRRLRRGIAKLAVTLLLSDLLLLGALGSPSASASDVCSKSPFGLYFDGFTNDPIVEPTATAQPYTEGVSASIRVEDGALCTGNSSSANKVSTWVMIYENSNHAQVRGVTGGLAQVGWEINPASLNPRFFWEQGDTDAGVTQYWHNNQSPGIVHRFG